MSCLKLYWPQTLSLYRPSDADWPNDPHGADEPVILAFERSRSRSDGGRQSALLSRARSIHANRCCPACGRAAVVPVDSDQIVMQRDQMPVPGTGRLVGFECDSCGHTWELDR